MENNNQEPLVPAEGATQNAPLNQDLVTYIGKNVDYYAIKWAKRDSKGKVAATWNGAAFFGGPIWLVYRKMYWQTAAYVVIAAVLNILIGLFVPGLGKALAYGIPVGLGFAANSLYYSHAEKETAALKAQYPLPSELDAHLTQRGGTNPLGAWILGIVGAVITCAVIVAISSAITSARF